MSMNSYHTKYKVEFAQHNLVISLMSGVMIDSCMFLGYEKIYKKNIISRLHACTKYTFDIF